MCIRDRCKLFFPLQEELRHFSITETGVHIVGRLLACLLEHHNVAGGKRAARIVCQMCIRDRSRLPVKLPCVVLRGALQVHITFPETMCPGRAGHPQKRLVLGLVAGSGPPDDLLVDLKIFAIKGGRCV